MGKSNKVHDIDRVRGSYGPHGDRDGVLSDHVRYVKQAGGRVQVDATGTERVGFVGGAYSLPVLCSEIVQGWDADGVPQSARCGAPVVPGSPWCEGHRMADEDEMDELCPHGMMAWLCVDPINHYGLD